MEKKGDSKGYDEKGAGAKGGKDSFCDDDKADSKCDTEFLDDGKGGDNVFDVPQVDVTEILIEPSSKCPVGDPLELKIMYSLDRDVVAGYWEVKFLVDSASSRIIKILGQTKVEDYPDGESEMNFE
ncbi:unnamed protein product, partial [Symbiodinium microadriaticum]